jgi:dihydropteroate synthase
VSADEEIARVVPVIAALAARTSVPISIDTMKARVAQAALEMPQVAVARMSQTAITH